MTDFATDVVVLGAGPAGENVADHATRHGLDVIIVERELVGGECSYWACMPSKALLVPPAVAARANRVPGAVSARAEVDVATVLDRRDGFASHWDDGAQVGWLEGVGVRLLRGEGRLSGPRRVRVVAGDGDAHDVEARVAVVVATGSTPVPPPIDGLDEIDTWSSRDATTASTVPRRLAVVGGGAVGVEMAQAWARLGATATLIEARERLLPDEEPFVGDELAAAFRAEGIEVLVDTAVEGVASRDDGIAVRVGGRTIDVDELLVATGRRPALEGIGLESIDLDAAEVDTDAERRVVGVDGGWLYMIGDAAGEVLLTHQGKYEARRIGEAIARGNAPDLRATELGPPRAVFTDPQVAAVGRTTAQARDAGVRLATATVELSSVAGGALREDDIRGRVHFVVDADRDVLVGATFVGPGVAEMLHAATIAVVGEVPLDRLRHAVPAFPTMSEVWFSLLEELDGVSGRPPRTG